MKKIKLLAILAMFFVLVSSTFAAGADDFVITVKTDNAGTSADTEFTIPTTGAGYDYEVDCDDANSGTNVSAQHLNGNYTCSYGAGNAGTYTIRIKDNSGAGTGFPRIYFNNTGDKDKITGITQWGTGHWTSMEYSFFGCSNVQMNAADTPDLSAVTSLFKMFDSADELQNSTGTWAWDTSHITNMAGVFTQADGFNEDVTGWNTSNVTTMQNLFYGTDFNRDISGWDVSDVTNLAGMFIGNTEFNQDISGWDVSNATDLSWMFYGATAFNQDISGWTINNTQDVNMRYMFNGATAFNQDISTWDTSRVTNMSLMFEGATSFDQDLGSGDGSDWDTSNVIDMNRMFRGATAFGTAHGDISTWDVSNVTTMGNMFQDAVNFNSDISGWHTDSLDSMYSMFSGAASFNQDINTAGGAWDISGVTSLNSVFSGATAFNGNISNWDISSVTDINSIFNGATAFNQDISGWNTAGITNMASMFRHATSFNQDISGWDVSDVTNMASMFSEATNFDQNLDSWDMAGVTNTNLMFNNMTLSTANYDALLNGWNARALNNGNVFNGGNSTYCATAAHDNMTDAGGHNWIITDGGIDANCPPVITSNGGGNSATVNAAENQTAVTTVVASDPNVGDILTYSITGGADQAKFSIVGATGVLTFQTAPDFENPTDADINNIYLVDVMVSDGTHTDAQALSVTVTDGLDATGHSRRSYSSKSVKKACKDSKATNFSNVGQHDQSLCEYAKEKKERVKEEQKRKEEKVEEVGEIEKRECSLIKAKKGLVRFGQRGQAVKDLQNYLNNNGFNAGGVDGIFGKLTLKAVKELQSKLGVAVDGIVGSETRGALKNCE